MQSQKQQLSQDTFLEQKIHRSTTMLPFDPLNSEYRCRICSFQNQANNALRSYCSCSIDKGGMHQKCLKQFLEVKVNKKVQKQLDYSTELQCQLCNQGYFVNLQTNYKCRESQNLKKQIRRNSFLIGILFIGFILSLIALISCSQQLNHSLKNQSTNKDVKFNQTLIAFIVVSIALLLLFSWKIITKLLIVAVITIKF